MNVKEFDDFFPRSIGHFPVFRPNSVQNSGFRFSVQNAKFRDSVRFLSKTISFSPKKCGIEPRAFINYWRTIKLLVQLLSLYTDPESHNAERYSQTDV